MIRRARGGPAVPHGEYGPYPLNNIPFVRYPSCTGRIRRIRPGRFRPRAVRAGRIRLGSPTARRPASGPGALITGRRVSAGPAAPPPRPARPAAPPAPAPDLAVTAPRPGLSVTLAGPRLVPDRSRAETRAAGAQRSRYPAAAALLWLLDPFKQPERDRTCAWMHELRACAGCMHTLGLALRASMRSMHARMRRTARERGSLSGCAWAGRAAVLEPRTRGQLAGTEDPGPAGPQVAPRRIDASGDRAAERPRGAVRPSGRARLARSSSDVWRAPGALARLARRRGCLARTPQPPDLLRTCSGLAQSTDA